MKTKKFKYIHYGKSYSCEVKKKKKKNFYIMLLCSFSSYETAFFF